MTTRPMHRKEKEITDPAAMHALIRASEVMRLALCVDNEPYVLPMSFGFDGKSVYFHSAAHGLKLDMLRQNPRVCCLFEHGLKLVRAGANPCAWGFDFSTVIVRGTAIRVTEPSAKLAALQCITDHYALTPVSVPEGKIAGVDVWAIVIEEMTGKRSG